MNAQDILTIPDNSVTSLCTDRLLFLHTAVRNSSHAEFLTCSLRPRNCGVHILGWLSLTVWAFITSINPSGGSGVTGEMFQMVAHRGKATGQGVFDLEEDSSA